MYTTNYYYTDGQHNILIARLLFNGVSISYEIICNLKVEQIPGLENTNFESHLENIIHLPILRYELRSKTLPTQFKPIHPNSLEHFLHIPCDGQFFRFSPVKKVS